MNKDQGKGTAEKAKGKTSDASGRSMGDTKQETKGAMPHTADHARKNPGDGKETAKKV